MEYTVGSMFVMLICGFVMGAGINQIFFIKKVSHLEIQNEELSKQSEFLWDKLEWYRSDRDIEYYKKHGISNEAETISELLEQAKEK